MVVGPGRAIASAPVIGAKPLPIAQSITHLQGQDSSGNWVRARLSDGTMSLTFASSGNTVTATQTAGGSFYFVGQNFHYRAYAIGRGRYLVQEYYPNAGETDWSVVLWTDRVEESAPDRWSHSYRCGDRRVTLREAGDGGLFYEARREPDGALLLHWSQGTRRNSGTSWIYEFRDQAVTHRLEDVWGRGGDRGWAEFRVYEGDRLTVQQACAK
ncbi:MAG: hypothetical protein Fur0042_23280 [Cyanophyceae cyanobacterium]